ncbi:hypothetical protein [Propionivibrio dicarboxylicus]|uniref:Uncharacterized protein n=1 Tax=Propionivibrio dicarboxylicus TaxID=83767 RepID=A0A1G7WXQ6_9RHOO|nr:hypothetical protein [Propionivibrio dicarboxylicus]SDG76719.1 hypothetical protein SAMN05660652_00669 [Propionivibrio dicarboxylicus]
MPNTIADARTLTLSDIVDQLGVKPDDDGKVNDTRELRSRGKDLYVKEERGAHPSVVSRKLHREYAIERVRDSLAAEFNTLPDKAQQVLHDVFGREPTQITVKNLLRLHELGTSAKNLYEKCGHNLPLAFEAAKGVEEFPQLPQYEQIAKRKLPAEHKEAEKTKLLERVAQELIDDYVDQSKALKDLVKEEDRPELFAILLSKMSELPDSFGSCTRDQKAMWIRFASILGHTGKDPKTNEKYRIFSRDQLRCMTVEQRLTMLGTLINRFSQLRLTHDNWILGHSAKPKWAEENFAEQKTMWRLYIWISQGFGLDELAPLEEVRALESFIKAASKDAFFRDAYARWDDKNQKERMEVCQRLVDLYADKFILMQHKPSVAFLDAADCPPRAFTRPSVIHPYFDSINFNKEKVLTGDFCSACNSILHELTHCYQHELIWLKNTFQMNRDDPRHLRVKIFEFGTACYQLPSFFENLGFSEETALFAYKQNVIEQHAYQIGDYTESRMRELFAQQDTTEQKSESGETEQVNDSGE